MSQTLPAVSPASVGTVDARITATMNAFGFCLHELLAQDDEDRNLLFSPAGVTMALALILNGAQEKTRQAITRAMGWPEIPLDHLNASFAAMRARHSTEYLRASYGSALLARDDYTFRSDFAQRAQAHYRAEIGNVYFIDFGIFTTINAWAKARSGGKIDILALPGDFHANTALALLNIFCFHGIWADGFNPMETEFGAFHAEDGAQETVVFMKREGTFDYFEMPSLQGIRLPFGDGCAFLTLLLPAANSSLREFHNRLNLQNWQSWQEHFAPREGRLRIPRLKADYRVDLPHTLSALGMDSLFSDANLGAMCPNLSALNHFRHHIHVELGEQGVSAPAPAPNGGGSDFVRMTINRPFFFAIHDKHGHILCMGDIRHQA